MVTTLTNDGWTGLTDGFWTPGSDIVTDNEEGIFIGSGTTANTLTGNDSLTGSGGFDDSNAVLTGLAPIYFGVENLGHIIMGNGANSLTGTAVGIGTITNSKKSQYFAFGVFNEEGSSITMNGNDCSITGTATGEVDLNGFKGSPFYIVGVYNRSGTITINGSNSSITGIGKSTVEIKVPEGKADISTGIFNRQGGTIAMYGNSNSLVGKGGYYNGIYNRGEITMDGNNCSITGTGIGDGAFGIYNQDFSVVDPSYSPPSINMEGNNNSLTGISKGIGSLGIVNEGIIDTGDGHGNSITGIAEEGGFAGIGNAGTITMGDKTDYLTGMGSISVLNFGEIDLGGGNDEVIAENGFAGGGNVNLGDGDDLITGFGTQMIDGGEGFDTAELGIASDDYSIVLGTTTDPYDVRIGDMTFTDVENFVFTDGTYSLEELPISSAPII